MRLMVTFRPHQQGAPNAPERCNQEVEPHEQSAFDK